MAGVRLLTASCILDIWSVVNLVPFKIWSRAGSKAVSESKNFCNPADSLNLLTNLSNHLTKSVKIGKTAVPILICNVSNEPLRYSTAPFKLLSFSLATSAAVTLLIAACMASAPAAPSFIAMLAARMASVPNIVLRAFCCCSAVKPFKLSCKICEISLNDLSLPSAV